MLDRPTPVHLRPAKTEAASPVCDLSILKQCLRFEQRLQSAALATIRLYKLAEDLDLYLSDFIDCTEDLRLVLELMASQ